MKLLEQLLDLVGFFSLKRWVSLLVILTTVFGALWIADSYIAYSQIYKLERSISLLERLDSLERKGGLSAEVDATRRAILLDVYALHKKPNAEQTPVEQSEAQSVDPWHTKPWVKFLSGGAPWLFISLFILLNANKDKSALATFFALQLFTIIFGAINYWIPSYNIAWIDHLLIPVGIFFVCIVIPLSFTAVASFKKVRDSATKKTISNNLRQLAAAADQFYLETGKSEASYDDLVGSEPTKYIKSMSSIDGERYDLIEFRLGKPLTVMRRSGEMVTYEN